MGPKQFYLQHADFLYHSEYVVCVLAYLNYMNVEQT